MGSCSAAAAEVLAPSVARLRRFQSLSLPLLPYLFQPRHWGIVGKVTSYSFPLYAFGIFLAGFPAIIGGHPELFKMFQLQSTLSSPALY
jgi:hypothetical protein